MTPSRIYDLLLEALSDPCIREELTERIASGASENIEGQTELFPRDDVTALSAENTALAGKAAVLELENSRLLGENAALRAQMKRYIDTLDEYSRDFGMQSALYEKYRRLSPKTSAAVKGFFKNDSVSGLFLCGVQQDNLKGLRSFTEKLAVDDLQGSGEDIAILDELYIYLLGCYNSTFTSPVYKLTDIKAGDDFCEDTCHNLGTARSGKISRVILQGCMFASNSKTVRKAIVMVP